MEPTVAVYGGGIGGLTAAHELAERGFDVTVFEANDRVGGKARSMTVPGTGDPGLPGEHGFRFFPGYYRHVTASMARIPDGHGGVVADHLVPTEATLLAGHDDTVLADTTTPTSVSGWYDRLQPGDAEIPASEQVFFAERLIELLTSCQRRRRQELDNQTFWDFLDASRMSDAFQRQVAATQSLVALDPKRASARTVGRIYVQLLRGQLDPQMDAERVLDGPTSEVWLGPWRSHLESLGVAFETRTSLRELHVDGERLSGATVAHGGDRQRVTADHHVVAVPVEVMAELLTPQLRRAAPELTGITQLDTAWMNGMQFYLQKDISLARGHQIYTESPWALTAISQAQFWTEEIGDRHEEVEGILSVIASDWTRPGPVTGKPAKECTPEEIRQEVWTQLTNHLDAELDESMVVDWFLDPELRPTDDGLENGAPLLINTVGSVKHRPSANPSVEGLTLAADYVDTDSDLASMESANEAGRLAAAAVIEAADVDADAPATWELREPAVFAPLKAQDRVRYRLGLPHPTQVRQDVGAAVRSLLS